MLLFATSKSAKEAFTKLFFETFSIQLEPADPLQSGMRSDLSDDDKRTLERVNPIRWPNSALEQDGDQRRSRSANPNATSKPEPPDTEALMASSMEDEQ